LIFQLQPISTFFFNLFSIILVIIPQVIRELFPYFILTFGFSIFH
jgi:hypothetical protein